MWPPLQERIAGQVKGQVYVLVNWKAVRKVEKHYKLRKRSLKLQNLDCVSERGGTHSQNTKQLAFFIKVNDAQNMKKTKACQSHYL